MANCRTIKEHFRWTLHRLSSRFVVCLCLSLINITSFLAKSKKCTFLETPFWQVIGGFEIIQAIQMCGNDDGQPFEEVQIVDCGRLDGKWFAFIFSMISTQITQFWRTKSPMSRLIWPIPIDRNFLTLLCMRQHRLHSFLHSFSRLGTLARILKAWNLF